MADGGVIMKEDDSSGTPESKRAPGIVLPQSWETLNCDGFHGAGAPMLTTMSTTEHKIDQIALILEHRLKALLAHRQTKEKSVQLSLTAKGKRGTTPNLRVIDTTAKAELRMFVSRVAYTYRTVSYHSFDHAAHVTLCADKMLDMLAEEEPESDLRHKYNEILSKADRNYVNIHTCVGGRRRALSWLSFPTNAVEADDKHLVFLRKTFGIKSDPLAMLAFVFAALIHDIEHTGLTNRQLVKEGHEVALLYKGPSVAEQHSIRVAFRILNREEFSNLRRLIIPTLEERLRLHQIAMKLLMSTDIASSECLKIVRRTWNDAFDVTYPAPFADCLRRHSCPDRVTDVKRPQRLMENEMESRGTEKRKAGALLEHMIQACDVAHTMQGWENFLKWNQKLFFEHWDAFQARQGHDPRINWFKSQIAFFDSYVLPLARKLLACGAFGDRGGTFLRCAFENRQRWLREGELVSQRMFAIISKRQKSCDVRRSRAA